VVVVKDPVNDRYFRFPESQAAILDLLRSPIDLDTWARLASERLNTDVPPATLGRIIDSLRSKNLLETEAPHAGHVRREQAARNDNWLYLRLFSVNAEPVLDWLAPKVAWAFTPMFHVFAAAMILTGIVITTIHARSLVGDALSLLSLSGLALIWLVIVGVGILHEFAHALTCRHFGGRVKELGFMLIYFQPAFYCDVSDSWMFPSRRERMWVTFAGGYFQLVLWGVAAVVWRIFAEGTAINWIAMTVLVFSGLQTLVNFNPLIKLDGYYMLSDYLDIPNLRSKALQAVRSRISGDHDPLLASEDRGSLLTFGALSLAFSTLLLTAVYVNIYILATSYFASAGLTAFLLFAGVTLRRTGAEPAAGARALVKRASLRKYRNLAIAGSLLLLTFIVPWKLRIPAEFTIHPGQERQVRASIDGMVEEVLVREGEKVHRGQELAYIHNSGLRERYTVLQGQYESKNAELQQLVEGPRQEAIEVARQAAATRRQELANVRRNQQDRISLERQLDALEAQRQQARIYAESQTLLYEDGGLVSRNSVDEAQQDLIAATARYDAMVAQIAGFDEANDREEDVSRERLAEAERELTALLAGASETQKGRVQNEALNLYAQMMDVSQDIRRGTVFAEITGKVVTADLELLEGATVTAGQMLLEVQSTGTILAELLVDEKDLADVGIGSPIRLVANTYPDRTFHGEVGQIAERAEVIDDRTFVRVRSELDNADGLLLADMTGHAKIDAGWRPVMQLITRELVQWIRTEFWHLLP
jgi:multidrug efflux pump subunit AcrA (membrane-fusion protein)